MRRSIPTAKANGIAPVSFVQVFVNTFVPVLFKVDSLVKELLCLMT